MITGWADDIAADIADQFNAKLAAWQEGLYTLDAESARLTEIAPFAALNSADAAEWQTQRDRIDFFSSTINAVGGAIQSIRGYVSDIGSSARLAGLSGLGILPAIPAAALAIITGGVVALGALIFSVKSFNDRITSQHFTEINAGLVREGKPQLTYPQQSDLFSNIGTVVQWGVIGAIALLVIRQIGQRRE